MKIAVITAATHSIPRFRIDMIDEFVRRGCDVVVLAMNLTRLGTSVSRNTLLLTAPIQFLETE